ncbi:hypothetical protein PIROE2DRAFT_11179 [Piromyces sp. E2]|nr:hypothetical protein PIROE2DRAFT_11179 [Piromyces sp. E2]|eukprot:OUM62489.1 hypothetical protein PIROE2DRAFT_11179 [Piromyces sp. E2]
MNNHLILTFITYLLLLILINEKVYGKEFYIKYDDSIYNDFNNFIKDNQNYDEIILYFIDDYYDMSKLPHYIDVTVSTNIFIIGNENGTVFDYKGNYQGRVIFNFSSNKEYKIIYENIIIENYFADKKGLNIINMDSNFNKFYFEVNNCTFHNNMSSIFRFGLNTSPQENPNIKILINNSRFFKNYKGIFYLNNHNVFIDDINNSLQIHVNNCTFIENNGIFMSRNSHIVLENSYISNVDLYTDYKNETYLFYKSSSLNDSFKIKNCIIENIDIKNYQPLITGDKIHLM